MPVTDSPQPPAAPAMVRERPGGDSMRAIVLEGFGGPDRVTEEGAAGGKMVVVMG